MSKRSSKSSKVDFSNFLPSLFIIAFLLVGFVPNLDAVDDFTPGFNFSNFAGAPCRAVLQIFFTSDHRPRISYGFYIEFD